MRRIEFLTAASLTAIALSLSANAQVDSSEQEGEETGLILSSVTVTATKKQDAEDVQSVPVAVTAFNAENLEALKVRDLEDLSFSSPNVSLDDIGTSKGVANFSIRGLGINSSIPSIDPTVGVFVDGVYLGINNGLIQDTFDLDSIEVLRGPQGLLAGRNTTGGAVYINTGRPTDDLQIGARVAAEGPVDDNRGGLSTFAQGYVSGPIIHDRLNGRIAIYYNNDDGYFENQFDGENHGASTSSIIRGSFEFFPTDTLTLLGKLEVTDIDADGPSAQNRGIFDRNSFEFSIDNPGDFGSDTVLFSLRSDWDVAFGNGTVTNIFGYRDFEGTTDGDIDATPAFIFHSNTLLEQEQISNELRYAGRFGDAGVTTGVFYFEQEIGYDEFRNLPPVTPLTFAGGGKQDHTVLGIFAQVDYDITDRLTAIGGLRYSAEEKDVILSFTVPRAQTCSLIAGSCPQDVVDNDSWENLTPKAGLQYTFSEQLQIYGSYTKGFRSGGYNFRITNPALFLSEAERTGRASFDEEEVDAYELGLKFQSEDSRRVLNLAVFSNEISDMQREVNVSDPVSGVSQFILNTADATILGFEAEGRLQITDSLLLTANVGLIDAEYDSVNADISGDGVVDSTDLALELPRVPEATYGFGFIWQNDIESIGRLSARANFQHRDEFAFTDNNLGFINAADMLNGSVGWDAPSGRYGVSLYGRNLLDEVVAGGDTQLPFGGPRSTGTPAPFASSPAAGTFSPLKPGRVIGLELVFRN